MPVEIVSLRFGILGIIAFLLFYIVPPRYRSGYLLLLSCGFIASYNIYLPIYLAFYAYFNFLIGKRIQTAKTPVSLFRIGVIVNLTQLILLRYYSFLIDPLFQLFDSNLSLSVISKIIIPLGISYYTLQGIGYLINIKMRWEKPEMSFINFFLYIIFFPKFLSGPIERSNHFLPQLQNAMVFNEEQVVTGLRIALFGFFKKVAIANQLAPFVMGVYGDLSSASGLTLWLLIVIQPLYLYFDFSGYTDIAIGFSKTMGIELLPNFNRPFFAQNMTTFWKRFHISLASWFNDYIFRQTSFRYRRWGIYATIWAMFITWTLFGIWHGAGWHFMFLGFLQAIAIIYEFFTRRWRAKQFAKLPKPVAVGIGRLFTYLFYGFSLIFFFAPDLRSAFQLFPSLFDLGHLDIMGVKISIFIMAILLITIFLGFEALQENSSDLLKNFWTGAGKGYSLVRWMLYFVVITMIIVLINETQEFIYFQF